MLAVDVGFCLIYVIRMYVSAAEGTCEITNKKTDTGKNPLEKKTLFVGSSHTSVKEVGLGKCNRFPERHLLQKHTVTMTSEFCSSSL